MNHREKFDTHQTNGFGQTKTEDELLIEGIEQGILASGVRGDEVTMMVTETLKRMGRYDLLPPCCR